MSGYLLTEDAMEWSSTVRRRQLGMEMRRLREAAGMQQQDAARWLDVNETVISKLETSKQKFSHAYLTMLLQLYDVGSPHADFLHRLRREANQRGWWAEYGKTVPSWFVDYIGMEFGADEVWTYQSEFVPGLLQTAKYAEAIIRLGSRTTREVERLVELRISRQQRLIAEDPLHLRAVINEGALRREVGGRVVMQDQLERLSDLAALPNVTIQVLPYTAGEHRGMRGAFTTLRFPDEPMNTVYLEMYDAGYYVEDPAKVSRFTQDFETLAGQAVPLDQVEGLR